MRRSQPTWPCSTPASSVSHPRAATGRAFPSFLDRAFVLAGLVALGPLAACSDPEPALARGDRFWADSNYTSALAEYRLAMRQDSSETTRLRVAHAYIETGQFERARELYDALLEEAPEYTDQAIFDYVTAARRAIARADRYELASAVEAALSLRPGLPLDDLAMPLARYYATTGDPARALDFYERALTVAPEDTVPSLLFEIARLHESQGNCAEAIGFFRAFRTRAPRDDRVGESEWHIGDCAFALARRARQDGDPERALGHIDTVLQLGVPEGIQDEAWFERGELLLALGRRDDALVAFFRVLELNRTGGGGQLVERARRRIDELRFGRVIGP